MNSLCFLWWRFSNYSILALSPWEGECPFIDFPQKGLIRQHWVVSCSGWCEYLCAFCSFHAGFIARGWRDDAPIFYYYLPKSDKNWEAMKAPRGKTSILHFSLCLWENLNGFLGGTEWGRWVQRAAWFTLCIFPIFRIWARILPTCTAQEWTLMPAWMKVRTFGIWSSWESRNIFIQVKLIYII